MTPQTASTAAAPVAVPRLISSWWIAAGLFVCGGKVCASFPLGRATLMPLPAATHSTATAPTSLFAKPTQVSRWSFACERVTQASFTWNCTALASDKHPGQMADAEIRVQYLGANGAVQCLPTLPVARTDVRSGKTTAAVTPWLAVTVPDNSWSPSQWSTKSTTQSRVPTRPRSTPP